MGSVVWLLGLSIAIGTIAIFIGGAHFLVLSFALSRSLLSPLVLSSGLPVLGLLLNLAAALVGVDQRRRPAISLVCCAIALNLGYIVFWIVRAVF